MDARPDSTIPPPLRPRTLLAAYASGAFPMPDADEDSRIVWFSPDPRGLLPLDERFHVPRRLRRTLRQERFAVTVDRAFPAVIRACADREEGTWITGDFIRAYTRLHGLELAHSVETWPAGGEDAGDEPVGGLYGVALGGAFFAESMFHRRTDAGKVALVALIERLRRRGFLLCDVQWLTRNLARFGAYAVGRAEYLDLLSRALAAGVRFRD